MNLQTAFETGNIAEILEYYTEFITDNKNRNFRKRGSRDIELPYSQWKNANGMRNFLISTNKTDWKKWEKIISNYQKNNAENLNTLCPKFATTFTTIVQEKINKKNESQNEFNKSAENAILKFEQEEQITKFEESSEISNIISLISSGATEIISPSGWQVKIQS
jgi:hypothetical protein